MKAKELAEILLKNPEFDVICTSSDDSFNIDRFYIFGVADIGYFDQKIVLDIKKSWT